MASGKKALRKFLEQAASYPDGAEFEVGLIYDVRAGWRVYQRIGEAMLLMSPENAERMAETYKRLGQEPHNARAYAELKDMFDAMRKLADEAEQKNRNKDIPPEYAAVMPAWGNA